MVESLLGTLKAVPRRSIDGRDGGDARRKQGQPPSPAVGAIREKPRIAIRDKIR